MSQSTPSQVVHFATRPFGEPYACGLIGYPNGPKAPNATDPERVRGCVICEAEAAAHMTGVEKNLVAIFMGCGCEVTSYARKDMPGVVMAPHSCIDHDGYFIGEAPPGNDYTVIYGTDDEVRRIWQDTLDELENEQSDQSHS